MNKKQFLAMSFLTPVFAAFVAVFVMSAILTPWQQKSESVEVPTLGNVKTEETTEENNVETKVETFITTDETAESVSNAPAKTEITSKNTNNTSKTTSNTTKNQKTTSKNTNSTKTSTTNKTTTKSAKELCEARTDGPIAFVLVHFLEPQQIERYQDWGIENPVVSYEKYVSASGEHFKMVYQNGSCNPDWTDRKKAIDDILEEDELTAYGITGDTDYSKWLYK